MVKGEYLMKLDYDKCKNCKYFIQHYNIGYNCINKVHCGHCIKQPNPNVFRLYSGKQPCPYFEKGKNEERRPKKCDIISLLTELNLNIENLKLFLNKKSKSQPISDLMVNKLEKRK